MTGAPVPQGADAVVIVEVTEQTGSKVSIFEPCKKGENICLLGEDILEGDVVLEPGKVLRAQEVGVLASVGRTKVRVFGRPEVAVIATGSEIVEPDVVPRPGQIRNSNGYSLSAQVVENGCAVRYLGIVGDRKPALEARIREGLEADVLILSGGVSMGAYDLVKETLRALGVRLLFEKVRMKPGKPTVFGMRDKTLVFGLPGNPVSTIVAFEQFVRPAIRKMAGYRTLERPRVHAVLERGFRKKPGRRLFAPAGTVHREDGWHTHAVASHGSADLLAMTRANSFLIVPEELGVLEAGARVEVQLLDCGFGIWDCGMENPKFRM
jgi:molybdopterin molybdotransferase